MIQSGVHNWRAQYIRELNGKHSGLKIDLAVHMSNVLKRPLRARELNLLILVEGVGSSDIVPEARAYYPLHRLASKGPIDIRKDD